MKRWQKIAASATVLGGLAVPAAMAAVPAVAPAVVASAPSTHYWD